MLPTDKLHDGVDELPSLGQPDKHRDEVEDVLNKGKFVLLEQQQPCQGAIWEINFNLLHSNKHIFETKLLFQFGTLFVI